MKNIAYLLQCIKKREKVKRLLFFGCFLFSLKMVAIEPFRQNNVKSYLNTQVNQVVVSKTNEVTKEVTTSKTRPSKALNFQILRLQLLMSDGSSRTMALGFHSSFTDEFVELGYDGAIIATPLPNDFGGLLDGIQFLIQALAPISNDKEIDLTFTSDGTLTYIIKSIEISNIAATQPIYLRDKLTGSYFNLRNTNGYKFSSAAGTFNQRFSVVFNEGGLSVPKEEISNTVLYYSENQGKLFVKGLKKPVNNIEVYNASGQKILENDAVSLSVLQNGMLMHNLSTGLYIVRLQLENNETLEKKIIIE